MDCPIAVWPFACVQLRVAHKGNVDDLPGAKWSQGQGVGNSFALLLEILEDQWKIRSRRDGHHFLSCTDCEPGAKWHLAMHKPLAAR